MKFCQANFTLFDRAHALRVADLTCAIAMQAGLSARVVGRYKKAAYLHDYGKIYLPADLLNKQGPVSDTEYEKIKEHISYGFDSLAILKIKGQSTCADVALLHHERLNGSGYIGLRAKAICAAGEMRTLSDKICEQHCLSVIRDPPKDGRSSRSHSEWQAEQEGKSTWRGLVKQDVDEAISQSAVWSQFLTGLKEKGYEVKSGVKHIAVRPPGKERFIRLRSLGDDYTEELIRKRLLNTSRDDQAVAENDELSTVTIKSGPSSNQPSPLYQSRPGYKPSPSLHHSYARKKRKGFVPLYIRYLIQMGSLRPRSSTRRTHFLLREDIRHLDRITAEFRLITDKHLDTYTDLLQYKQALSDQIIHLMSERKGLQLQIKREISEIPPPALKEASKTITTQIRRNRREQALCDDIKRRSIEMTGKIKQIKQEKSTPLQIKKEEHAHDQRR